MPNSPKPILKLAGQNDLLPSPVDRWLNYADARTGTAHGYSSQRARETLLIVEAFLGDAIGLYKRMSGKSWE